ncbi:MAG: Plipastatin synthase subunit [Pseudomonadota bacterium]
MNRLDDLLWASASADPAALCLIERDGTTETYGGLAARAEAIAAILRKAGVRPGDRVGLSARKSAPVVAAIFAILRLGAVYVPVDPTAPAARSGGIFSDCTVKAILADPEPAAALAEVMAPSHPVSPAGSADALTLLVHSGPCEAAPEGTAYILYTSGSTGKPKGVVHTHASALAFVDWCSATFRPGPSDRFSSHAPFHFDLSVLDLYVAARHGAAIRLIDAEEGRQPAAMTAMIETDRLTIWYSTPTVLRSMVEFGAMERHDLSSLRVLCFAGEVFPPRHLRALAERLPGPLYYNLYGPTETNVCTYFHFASPGALADNADIPIGFVCSSDELLVVGEGDQPVPPGSEGELLVSGGSVMTGYWGLPERNATAFARIGGRRWYRTGDIVQTRPADGALLYRGRRDRMVKRRGFRIELDEIEAAMLRHDAISRGAAVAVTDAAGDARIVFFLSAAGSIAPSMLDLKRFAAKHLPLYMSPDRFEVLDAIPMTSTDKIHYQALKERALGLYAQ